MHTRAYILESVGVRSRCSISNYMGAKRGVPFQRKDCCNDDQILKDRMVASFMWLVRWENELQM